MHILLVEDDPTHTAAVERSLHSYGYKISTATSGEEALRLLKATVYDLVILDWQLPKMSGFEVLQRIRAHLGSEPPVLFLTSRVLEVDIVVALEAGADEYVIKPFRLSELAARVRALLRRMKRDTVGGELVSVGDYMLDPKRRTVSLRGRPMALTTKEFDLASLLFNNMGRIISRELLASLAWGRELDATSRTIDTHIYRIRQKLSLNPVNGVRLITVYTHGYRLDKVSPPAGNDDGLL